MKSLYNKYLKLARNDGKVVDITYYDNSNIEIIEVLNIKTLKFEGIKTKDIKKSQIHNAVLKGEEKVYLQNNKSKISASLSKRHLNKIISTIFTRDKDSRYTYLKKEIISNVDIIFREAIPILKHSELKKPLLYNTQIVHRFAIPLKIGGLIFFIMITVKERIDFDYAQIDEFTIYDLYSEFKQNKKSSDSSSKASTRNNPATFLSHYQMTDYSINDLIEFVKINLEKYSY